MTLQDLVALGMFHIMSGRAADAEPCLRVAQDMAPDNATVRALAALLRGTMLGALRLLQRRGFAPRTVIDVGAQVGTQALTAVFPDACHVLLEPVAEHEAALRAFAGPLAEAEILIAAAGDHDGEVPLWVSQDRRNASVAPGRDSEPGLRRIPQWRLDSLVASRGLEPPFLVKIDVDGQELAVLEGARALAAGGQAAFVVEATLLGDPGNFVRLQRAFAELGYAVLDIIDPLRRPSDFTLWQVDLVLVPKNSPWRPAPEFC